MFTKIVICLLFLTKLQNLRKNLFSATQEPSLKVSFAKIVQINLLNEIKVLHYVLIFEKNEVVEVVAKINVREI